MHIQGFRHILWVNGYAMARDGLPEHTIAAKVSDKFMRATLGPKMNTMWL